MKFNHLQRSSTTSSPSVVLPPVLSVLRKIWFQSILLATCQDEAIVFHKYEESKIARLVLICPKFLSNHIAWVAGLLVSCSTCLNRHQCLFSYPVKIYVFSLRLNNRSWHECFDSKVPFHIGAEQSCQACIKIAIKVKTYCREKSIVSVVAQASVKCLEVISLSCFVVSDIITHYTENVWWNAVMHHFYWFCFNWQGNFRHGVA